MSPKAQEHTTFTIVRVYHNCRDHVWSAWSSVESKKAWFGEGLKQMEFRPGGFEHSGFRNDMGTHTNDTRYFEIKQGERIVLAYSMSLNGDVHTVSLATILFEDENGGTRLTYTEQMCIIPPSDGAQGRMHGWNALLDSLAQVLARETNKAAR